MVQFPNSERIERNRELEALLQRSARAFAALPKHEQDAIIRKQIESAAKAEASWPETRMAMKP